MIIIRHFIAAILLSGSAIYAADPVPPMPVDREPNLVGTSWKMVNQPGQQAWGVLLFKEGGEFVTTTGPRGKWKTINRWLLELEGDYAARFTPGFERCVVTGKGGVSVGTGSPVPVGIQMPDHAGLAKAQEEGMAMNQGMGSYPGVMQGRRAANRAVVIKMFRMKPATEQAVLRGLEWLRDNQNGDGSWGDANKGAMTGFALLCFLGHDETGESARYGVTVSKAIQWMIDRGTKSLGRMSMEPEFTQPGVYEHGIATFALGEYFAMTRDERVMELLKQAMTYIIDGQGQDGGWMYGYDKTQSDTSVSGWQIQALKGAWLSKLDIPGLDRALDRAMKNLERVKGPNGGYGYRRAEDRYSLTGVGIFCSLIWKGAGDQRKGIEWLLATTEKRGGVKYLGEYADLYAWYYHTQACLLYGGSAWQKWNAWFQDEITSAQSPDGSWPITGGKGHKENDPTKTGQIYRTTLCTLMLESFYRYMPPNR